jgi:hypothetical protein
MTPGRLPLSLYRGDTYRWQFKLWLDTARTLPADLSGAFALAQIRDKAGGTLIVSMSCAVTVPNFIDMVLSATDSAKLPNSGAWDLQVTYASGDVATVLGGPVNTTADVTTAAAVTTAVAPARLVAARR